MRYLRIRASLAIAGTLGAALSLVAQPAFADNAPTSRDAVGVGSSTMQYLMDFVADGDVLGDAGYNTAGNKDRLVNFDGTTDGNERVAYGPDGIGGGLCSPATGPTAGTGNQTTKHQDPICTLNPTIVLRAATRPVQRPWDSTAGAAALAGDTGHLITYTRCTQACLSTPTFDSVEIGTDTLAMAVANVTNAVPLSGQQLNQIYSCNFTAWSQVGNPTGGTIIPIIPPVGSETRAQFLAAIGNPSLGTCVVTAANENDPTAIRLQANPANAIEPMSAGILNLYQGLLPTGTPTGAGGYFQDPSCPLQDLDSGAPSACASGASPNSIINPTVHLVTTGTPSDANALFEVPNRPLYISFRDADVNSTTPFQPGGTLNAIRTLFYNPCPTGSTGCVTIGGITYGPGGQPFVATAAGETLIAAAGINPTYVP